MPQGKRDLILAYDEMVCESCGHLRSECSDPMVDWHPGTDVCWATATREWAEGVLQRRHEKDPVGDGELSYLNGRWVYVSRMPPEPGQDEFATPA